MNKDIIITVTSCTGVGKTTVAEMITRLLANEGFDVTHDPGLDGPRNSTVDEQLVREAVISEQSKILVNEKSRTRQECYNDDV